MKYHYLTCIVSMLLLACNKGDNYIDENSVAREPIGLISFEEFIASTPPTYDEFLIAYENVTNNNPELFDDEELLARRIFDYIKIQSDNELKTTTAQAGANVWDLVNMMTIEEWKVVLLNPIDAGLSLRSVEISRGRTIASFPCEIDNAIFDGSKANALYHAYWSALMARRSNVDFAEKMGNAHEEVDNNPELDKAMDLHNNNFGRNIEKQYPNATEDELLMLLLEQKYFFVSNLSDFPDDANQLVYRRGKRKFDVIMKGSLGNPDSGGDWEMILYLSQCDNILRGRYEIKRGEAFQQRRFSGSIINGQIILEVSNPYNFENPDGLSYCSGVKMTLSGDETQLIGSWTSRNCYRGGKVMLTQ